MNKKQLEQLYYKEGKTLQQIGNIYGVTRERVRQIMERFGLPRYKSYRNFVGGSKSRFKTIDEYFRYIKSGGEESHNILSKFMVPLKKRCEYCNSIKNLQIHHVKYPAESLDDIKILCCPCHIAEHKKGIGINSQIEIGNKYINGKNGVELANEYNVSRGLIYCILRKRKIPRRSRWWSQPLDKKFICANI